MKKILPLFFALVVFVALPNFVIAHPGGTDSSGCHTCRTNCTDWGLSYGEYHCHNNKGTPQPSYPVSSTYGSYGTGYTTPNPSYAYPSYPTTPSCPSMSSYDSLSGSCKCYSGYSVSGGSCVSDDTICHNQIGYSSSYDSLSDTCKCNYGYIIGTNGQCTNASLYCSAKIGLMSQYNSSSKSCECMYGYEFNGSSCVRKSTSSGSTYSSYTPSYSGSSDSSCPTNSSPSSTDSTKCSCNTGYQTNTAKDACITIPKTKDQECKDGFGVNSSWNGTFIASNGLELPNCICDSGYQWNTEKTTCSKIVIAPTPIATPVQPPVIEPTIIKKENPKIETLKPAIKQEQPKPLKKPVFETKPLSPSAIAKSSTGTAEVVLSTTTTEKIEVQKGQFFQKIWKRLFGWF